MNELLHFVNKTFGYIVMSYLGLLIDIILLYIDYVAIDESLGGNMNIDS